FDAERRVFQEARDVVVREQDPELQEREVYRVGGAHRLVLPVRVLGEPRVERVVGHRLRHALASTLTAYAGPTPSCSLRTCYCGWTTHTSPTTSPHVGACGAMFAAATSVKNGRRMLVRCAGS